MLRKTALTALIAVVPASAFAQDVLVESAASSADTAWVLVAALLTLAFAVPGVAAMRPSGALAVGAAVATGSLVWIIAGYTLAFGDPLNGWIGSGRAWMLNHLGEVRDGLTIPESAFAMFGLAAACVPLAMLASALARRARAGWIAVFAAFWLAMVYAPAAHWMWGGGWLMNRIGALDFAGGIVLQTSVGVSALVVGLLAGRADDGEDAPRSVALWPPALAWVGWLALIGGSAMAASDNAAAAIINGQIGAATGAIVWLLLGALTRSAEGGAGWATGSFAGLAAISAGAGFVGPGGAMVIALGGTLAAWLASRALAPRLRIGAAGELLTVNAIGGAAGAILLAVFLDDALGGVGYFDGAGMAKQIAAQVIAVCAIALWSAVASAILTLVVSLVMPMRSARPAVE